MTLPSPSALDLALDNLYTDALNGTKLYLDPPADVTLRNGNVVPNLRKRLQAVTDAADQLGELEAVVASTAAAAAVLDGFALPTWGAFTTDAALDNGRGPYLLPYDPGNAAYVLLSLGGVFPQTGFVLVAMDGGTGLLFDDDWPSGIEARYCLQRPIPYDPTQGTLTPEQFGALGNGTGDDAAAILTAIQTADGRPVVGAPGAVYRLTTALDYTGTVRLDLSRANILVDADVQPFRFSATTTGPFALSHDYDPVASPLLLRVTGLSAAPTPGQLLWIASEARDPGNRDNGSSAQQYRCGEAVFVGEGSTATDIVLASPLAMSSGIAPASGVGDEATVAAYTVAYGAAIAIPDMTQACDVRLPVSRFAEGHDGDGWDKPLAEFRGYFQGRASVESLMNGYGAAVLTSGTYGFEVDHVDARSLTDNAPDQLGYVVADRGWMTRVNGLTAANVRHAYTTNKATTSYPKPAVDPYLLMACGRTVGAVIDGGHAVGGTAAAYSPHADGENITFANAVAEGTGSDAFGIRGRAIVLDAPQIRNCAAGIRYITEFDDGDADDDRYNNGKRRVDFTSGSMISPTMEVRGRCLDVRAADLLVTGNGRYRSTSHGVIYNSGGFLSLSGYHEFVVDGAAAAVGEPIIDVAPNNAYSSMAFPTPEVVIDGTVIIDARNSPVAGMIGIRRQSGTRITVRGLLRLLLPAGATLLDGNENGIVCEGGGRIEYSIEGSAGIVTGLTNRPIYLVDLASGEVMDGTSRRKDFVGYNQVTDHTANSLIVRHSGGATGGFRLRNLDTALGNGEGAGSVTCETNDTSKPVLDAARVLFRGAGTQGYVDTVVQRTNSAAADALRDALLVAANGDVTVYRDDGSTPSVFFDASSGEVQISGIPTAPTAAAGTNTTQLATTEHVFAERANAATLTNKTLASPVITGAVTGSAVQSASTDATAGRMLLAGASATVLSASPALRQTVGGTADALTLTTGAVISGTVPTGLQLRFRAASTNTGAATIALDGGAAIACRTITGVALPAGYIRVGVDTVALYDGAYWVLDRQIERASAGANGAYVRLADGTQICTVVLMSGVSTTLTWTFPVPFVDVEFLAVTATPCTGADAISASCRIPVAASVGFNAWNMTTGTRAAVSVRMNATGEWY